MRHAWPLDKDDPRTIRGYCAIDSGFHLWQSYVLRELNL